MKKLMLAGLLLALGSTAMAADSAQIVLKKAREDYYKQQEAQRKAGRVSERAEKVKREKTSDNVDEIEVVEVEEEEAKPRTAMEKLEYNANKAALKVDFYERVVRSVEREEKELENYKGTLKLNRVREKKMKRSEERREKIQKKKK